MDRKWWTLLVVCAGTFMLLLDVSAVTIAIPSIQRGLHADFVDIQWMIDAYNLALASLLLTSGALADRYGRKRIFLAGLVVFSAGSVLCGCAQSPLMLVCARAIQGIGGAMTYATALALIAQSFRGAERGVAFGVWGTITGVALGLGPVLGGVITTGISWRGIFLVNVPIGIAALIVGIREIDGSHKREDHRPDLLGFASMTLFLFALVYGLIRAGEVGWGATSVWASFVAAIALLVTFIVTELRSAHPMFDFALFRIPTVTGGLLSGFAMNGSLFAVNLYLILYLQEIRGYSAMQTGVRVLVSTGGMLVPRIASGRLTGRVPVRWLLGPGLVLVGIGLLLMSGIGPEDSWTYLIPGLIVSGIGSGLVNPALASTAVGVVEPRQAGMAGGMNSTFRQIGMATSIAAFGTIFAASLHRQLVANLASIPALAPKTDAITKVVRKGEAQHLIASSSPHLQAGLSGAINSSFASSLGLLFVVAAGIAFAGAAAAFILVRPQDFHAHHHVGPPPVSRQADTPIETEAELAGTTSA